MIDHNENIRKGANGCITSFKLIMNAIEVQNLSKTYKVKVSQNNLRNSIEHFFIPEYRYVEAVKDVSFSIKQGTIVGLVGLNGAGKSTTLKLLSGLIYPTEGQIKVLGYEPWKKEKTFLKSIGWITGQKNQMTWDLAANDSYELERVLYGVSKQQSKRIITELSEMLDVANYLDVPIRKLSMGQRMKLEIINILIHTPQLLLMDEPTVGLDILAQSNLRDFFKSYNQLYGNTIVITSHNMKDIESICEQIIIINKGKVIFNDSIEVFKKLYSKKMVVSLKDTDIMYQPFFENKVIRQEDNKVHLLVSEDQINFTMEQWRQIDSGAEIQLFDLDFEEMVEYMFK